MAKAIKTPTTTKSEQLQKVVKEVKSHTLPTAQAPKKPPTKPS